MCGILGYQDPWLLCRRRCQDRGKGESPAVLKVLPRRCEGRPVVLEMSPSVLSKEDRSTSHSGMLSLNPNKLGFVLLMGPCHVSVSPEGQSWGGGGSHSFMRESTVIGQSQFVSAQGCGSVGALSTKLKSVCCACCAVYLFACQVAQFAPFYRVGASIFRNPPLSPPPCRHQIIRCYVEVISKMQLFPQQEAR